LSKFITLRSLTFEFINYPRDVFAATLFTSLLSLPFEFFELPLLLLLHLVLTLLILLSQLLHKPLLEIVNRLVHLYHIRFIPILISYQSRHLYLRYRLPELLKERCRTKE
jgi:hypothetical protein